MEKVKYGLRRMLTTANIMILFSLLPEIFRRAGFEKIIIFYGKMFFFGNAVVIVGVVILNQFLKGGFWYSLTGIEIGSTFSNKRVHLDWNQVSIDLKQKIRPRHFGSSCKVEIQNPYGKQRLFMYINTGNEQSFVELTEKYAPKDNVLRFVIAEYFRK